MESKGKAFRRLLQDEPYLFTGGIYSPLDAQIAERAGMKSIYLSGYSVAMLNGWPDMGFLTQTEVTQIASMVASAVEVPIIAAVNGPAMRHADLALMCDIVLAADNATFEDTAHFHNGSIVPGDGINVVFTMLLGLNRARYLMLTGQVLGAREAKDLGLVAELMPREKLLARAWELAQQLAKKSDMLLRYTRAVLTHPLKKQIDEGLPYFLAMETLSTLDKSTGR